MKFSTALALLLGLACVARASTITVNVTRDLLINPSGWTIPLPGGPVPIATGDHVVHTVDFLGNQALTIGDGNEWMKVFLYGPGNNSFVTVANASIELLGFSGTGGAASTYFLGTQVTGQANIGTEMSDFLTAGQSVTFTGVRTTYDVQSLLYSPYEYTKDWLLYDSRQLQVGTVPVPDGSGTLLFIGIGLLALAVARPSRSLRPVVW